MASNALDETSLEVLDEDGSTWVNYNYKRDSNSWPLLLRVTAIPADPQPLPQLFSFIKRATLDSSTFLFTLSELQLIDKSSEQLKGFEPLTIDTLVTSLPAEPPPMLQIVF